jgi:hypothetical protein
MNLLSRIAPVTDAEAARLASPGTFAAMAADITSSPLAASGPAELPARGLRRRSPARRRLLIGVPAAAGLAVAGLVIASAAAPGSHVGPVKIGPAPAQAAVLSITRHHGYLRVIVNNPVADPKRYRAEFAKYHLNISLRLVPASPSIVGTLVYSSYPSGGAHGIVPITATGRCFTGGGGNVCPVGVRVPLNFHGAADLVFGRAARAGEQYESAGPVSAPGEAMHGLHYIGKTVARVTAMLARRGVTVAQWRAQTKKCYSASPKSVPGSWFVSGAVPWAAGQVLLFTSQTWPASACLSAPGQPVASPAPSAG